MERKVINGLDFLFKEIKAEEIFTTIEFSEEHRMVMKTTKDFVANEIVPNIGRIESLDLSLTRDLLKKAGDIGLLGAEIPEEYGGVGLDKIASLIIAEELGRGGSIAISYGAHSGLAALPIAYFGNEEQKKKYLPKFCSGELFGAFALTESEAGSDAMAGKTKAELSADGSYYTLNGEKMWITNAGFADIFIVYAKVQGKFTAFIVEKAFGGITPGLEEKKMGIKGSSTAAVCIDNVNVPVCNLLWGIGNGLKVALNILNLGRIKIGSGCIGAAKLAIDDSIRYANERKQFGKPISSLGAIKEKIARMIIKTYAGESIIYRTGGMIDDVMKTTTDIDSYGKALSEHATECAICKVMCSEYLDYVVDEAVQIHGGYGYSADYPIERYYRDSRINRIFEGTNEINRLVVSSMILRKVSRSKAEIEKLSEDIIKNQDKVIYQYEPNLMKEEYRAIAGSKKCLIAALTILLKKFPDDILTRQEIIFRIADIAMEIYVSESVILKAIKEEANKSIKDKIAIMYCHDALYKIYKLLIEIFEAVCVKEELENMVTLMNKYINIPHYNTIDLLKEIAERGIEMNCYPI